MQYDLEKILEDHRQSIQREIKNLNESYTKTLQYTVKDDNLKEEEKQQALLNSIRHAELVLKVEDEERTETRKYLKKLKSYFLFDEEDIQSMREANLSSMGNANNFISLLKNIDKNHILGHGKTAHYSFVTEIILLYRWLRLDFIESKEDIRAFKQLEKYGVRKEDFLPKNEINQFELFSQIGLNGIASFIYKYFQTDFNIDEQVSKNIFSILLYGQERNTRLGKDKSTSNLADIPSQDHEYKFL